MNLPQTDPDEAIFRVGRVVAVRGRTVSVKVDRAKNGSHLLYRGNLLRNVSVGGYVKISKGFFDLIAKVDGEVVSEAAASEYASRRDRVERILTVSLIGYLSPVGFARGIREMPLIDNVCYLLTESEFDTVHNFVSPDDTAIVIGRIATEPSQEVRVGVNNLFASHIGVFGNTGSGKSYTLAKLYSQLFSTFGSNAGFQANARVLVIDFNGEYVNRDGAGPSSAVIAAEVAKTEYRLSTKSEGGADKLPIPADLMEQPEFWTVLLDATEKTQAPFIRRGLANQYWADALADKAQLSIRLARLIHTALISADVAAKNNVVRLLQELDGCLAATAGAVKKYVSDLSKDLQFHSVSKVYQYKLTGTLYWGNQHTSEIEADTSARVAALGLDAENSNALDRIRLRLILQYYDDIFRGFGNAEHLGPVMKRLETRAPLFKKLIEVADGELLTSPLTVVSLRNVNVEMKKVIPLILCRYLYDRHKGDSADGKYLNIVIDEAHNILSSSSTRESEAWKDYRLETFEEMIKEGRKFGVFLTIASQRPHDISETIISQLHNYFLHRLVNVLDIKAIERSVSYLDAVSFESLSILPTGTCVLSGVSSQVPLLVAMDPLAPEQAPNSQTMVLSQTWSATTLPGT